jgi:hypothetical protein
MPAARATASRSSRVGWEDWWKSCSSLMSCTLVKRLRVRRAASSEDMLAAEDVLLSVDVCMVVGDGSKATVFKHEHPNEPVAVRVRHVIASRM